MSGCQDLYDLIYRAQSQQERDIFNEQVSRCFIDSAKNDLVLLIAANTITQHATSPVTLTGHDQRQVYAEHGEFAPLLADDKCQLYLPITNINDLEHYLKLYPRSKKAFFVRQRNSRSRLAVNREMFEALCRHCGVFEQLKQFVICFGVRKTEVFNSPPSLRWVPLSRSQSSAGSVLRSGFELSYLVRMVEHNPQSNTFEWSLRQACVYHKLDPDDRNQTWIFIAATSTLKNAYEVYLGQQCEKSRVEHSFEMHYVLMASALSGWRGCIDYLAGETQQQSDSVFMAEIGATDFSTFRLTERQALKRMEDFIGELLLALFIMLENMSMIIEQFHSFVAFAEFENRSGGNDENQDQNQDDGTTISAGFRRLKKDIERYQLQLQSLQHKIQNTANLLSNMLELSNGAALKLLALETKAENARAALLAQRSVEDAATVKVLTVVTLVYLPLTVVTNFFSTSFVGTNSTSISITSDVWILFVIGLPLTAITVYVWWVFAQKEVKGDFPAHLQRALCWSTSLFHSPKKSTSLKPTYSDRRAIPI